jgi:hypothetical protein
MAIWLHMTPQAAPSLREAARTTIDAHKAKSLQHMIANRDKVSLDLIVNGINTYGGHVNHRKPSNEDVFPKSPLARTQNLHICGNMRLPWGFDDVQRAIFGDQVPLLILRDKFLIDMVALWGHHLCCQLVRLG